jgi:rhodanese-related sulfurtransferase
MSEVILDVRERDEYSAEHIPGSIHVPLSQFDSAGPGVLSHFLDRKIIVMCRSGKRASMAAKQITQMGFDPKGGIEIYEGGILQWKALGKPIQVSKPFHLPILRQTHLAAGLLAFAGVLGGFLVSPYFFLLSGFVGFGLMVAGATGLCMMSEILAKAPWNKAIPNIKKEVCMASKGVGCDSENVGGAL